MASSQSTVDFVLEQIAAAGEVSARKMFGEYGVYCDGRIVGLICDDSFFVKPTKAGEAFAPDLEQAPPYPGAKPYIRIDAGRLEDADWLADLVRRTAAELPLPKPRKPKKRRAK